MTLFKTALYRTGISLYIGCSAIAGLTPPVKAESSLGVAFTQQSPAFKISQTFKTTNRGTPKKTTGGATRQGSCFTKSDQLQKSNKPVKLLVPPEKWSLTVSERPTFFLHKQQSSSEPIAYLYLDKVESKNNDGVNRLTSLSTSTPVYEAQTKLPKEKGIVALTLPPNSPILQDGQRYKWAIYVSCNNDGEVSGNPDLEGWVEKQKPNLAMSQRLERIDKKDKKQLAEVYANAGIWHETMTTAVERRCESPDDIKVINDWKQLLESVGLQEVVSEPILNNCKPINNWTVETSDIADL